MKEFICLSCWETFEFSSSDIRGKDTVTCPHCGAEQEILDDVVGLNEGNLGESESTDEDTSSDTPNNEAAIDDLLSAAGIEADDAGEKTAEKTTDSPSGEGASEVGFDEEITDSTSEDETVEPSDSDESPGIEFDSSDVPDSVETLTASEFDPLDESASDALQDDHDSGIEFLGDAKEEEREDLPEQVGIELFSPDESEDVENFDLLGDETSLKELIEQDTDPSLELSDEPTSEETSDELDHEEESLADNEPEIGTLFSKENAEEHAALSKSVQELVSSITEREISSEVEGSRPQDEDVDSLVSADTLDDLALGEETLSELEAQFDHAGGLDFDLEGLEVDSETDIESADIESADIESADIESAEMDSMDDEVVEDIEEENEEQASEKDDDAEPEEPMGFALVSEDELSEPEKSAEESALIDEDELTDAVSELFEGGQEPEEETLDVEEAEKVKSWRVKLKSGLILSFPSLIVVQGWAADKDTSNIGLARGDGEFKPYEQVLGMMQTIETKALNPGDIEAKEEDEEDEVIDGLSAAARAAAQRRRDGKMENITAEYQFRKDAFKKQKSSSPKKLFLVIGLLVVLAGSAVALEFLAIVDLGLGFAPASPSAPAPAPPTQKTGPSFNVGTSATPEAKGAPSKKEKAPAAAKKAEKPSAKKTEKPGKTTKQKSKASGKKAKKKKAKKAKKPKK